MVDFVAFGIILDDIVSPDGETRMGMLGGGGPQTAFGMRLWCDSVGLSARVGADLPASALEWLDEAGIERTGVIQNELPTPRAWQVLEEDGRRTQVWRVPGQVIGRQLARSIEQLPEAYRGAQGFHFGVHPNQPENFARALQGLGGLVSIEPFKAAEPPLEDEQAAELLGSADVFSPNLSEAASIVGPGSPQDILNRMGRLGGRVITLRMGAEGSFVTSDGGINTMHIPAFPVKVIDPVGAGNAYCGGLLAGWCLTGDILTAGRYASVSASFLLEQYGLPAYNQALQVEANRRLEWLAESE